MSEKTTQEKVREILREFKRNVLAYCGHCQSGDKEICECCEDFGLSFYGGETALTALMIEFAEKCILSTQDISKELDQWADKHGDVRFISFGYAFNDEFSEHLSGIMKENIRRKGE